MKLELFIMETCPYCRRVLKAIEESGRTDITYFDINKSDEAYCRLMKEGGKRQVPCLLIDGKPLYESLDIIDWLAAHPE